MHLNCPLKFCIGIVFNFLFWDGCNSKEIFEKKYGRGEGQTVCNMGNDKMAIPLKMNKLLRSSSVLLHILL